MQNPIVLRRRELGRARRAKLARKLGHLAQQYRKMRLPTRRVVEAFARLQQHLMTMANKRIENLEATDGGT